MENIVDAINSLIGSKALIGLCAPDIFSLGKLQAALEAG